MKRLAKSGDDFEIDDASAWDSTEEIEQEVPDRLLHWLDRILNQCRDSNDKDFKMYQIGVQHFDGKGWKRLKKRVRYTAEHQPDAEDAGARIIEMARAHSAATGRNSNYRTFIELRKSNGETALRHCAFSSSQDATGDISFYDGEDKELNADGKFGLNVMDRVLGHMEEQNNSLFAVAMETIAEAREDARESRKESREYADSIREIGNGMGTLTNSVVGAIQAAADIAKSFSEENAQVQLAKIEGEAEATKFALLEEFLGKVAGPAIGAQIKSSMEKRKRKTHSLPEAEAEGKKKKTSKKKSSKKSSKKKPENQKTDRDGFPKNVGKKLQSIFVDLGDRCSNVQGILGDDDFRVLADAAESGKNSDARDALRHFRRTMDTMLSSDQFSALGRMSALQQVMGDELIGRFAELIPDSEEE